MRLVDRGCRCSPLLLALLPLLPALVPRRNISRKLSRERSAAAPFDACVDDSPSAFAAFFASSRARFVFGLPLSSSASSVRCADAPRRAAPRLSSQSFSARSRAPDPASARPFLPTWGLKAEYHG